MKSFLLLPLFLLFLFFLPLASPLSIVAGGQGYVGSKITSLLNSSDEKTLTIGRSQSPTTQTTLTSHLALDLTTSDPLIPLLEFLKTSPTPIKTIYHAVGCLLDEASGLGNLNKYASGTSRSPGQSYDLVTSKTVFNLVKTVTSHCEETNAPLPNFVFISAAEVGWPDVAGGKVIESLSPEWLQRYLAAKRKAESCIISSSFKGEAERGAVEATS